MEPAFRDFAIGRLVWVQNAQGEWKEGRILGLSGSVLEVELLETGQSLSIQRSSQAYKTMHEDSVNGVDDMTTLAELHEGSLLRNLRIRFDQDTIYTLTGTILVSLNPYKPVTIYTQETIRQYKGEAIGALPPHIFSIADDSYRTLLEEQQNKSILISGESGAGKTEATKLILQFLTHLSGSHSPVEQLLLESSPILEAFGNAQTSINDNSSRFGKYLEVFFSPKGTIIGGRITDYLLEKSRIVKHASHDRNYHIFYTILACLPEKERVHLKLDSIAHFRYLQGGDEGKKGHFESPKAFQELMDSMSIVGFNHEIRANIFRVVAAILHIGNISFQAKADDSSEISNKDVLGIVAQLLELEPEQFETAVTTILVKTGKDSIQKTIPIQKAEATRDTIAKALYGRLFGWIVSSINEAMKLKKNVEAFTEERSVGVLDIFGFEIVQNNSFEQFCINMANETLQSFFNARIFQMEQEEYEREGISWQTIKFEDNSQCLSLLYKGKLSLLNLLDEESSFPSATDDTLVKKFHENHTDSKCYEKPQGSAKEFMIVHYAGKVTYKTPGFLEKNSDSLNDGIILLFKESASPMINSWFEKDQDQLQLRGTIKRGYKPPTVGAQFKESLNLLMARLEATDPYFIRCIKPNMNKEPSNFCSEVVLKQLRNTGMLETIRIRQLGYPLRLSFEDFYSRYFMLKPDIQKNAGEFKDRCLLIVNEMRLSIEDFQLGRAKVFMRAPAQKILEARRHEILAKASVRLSAFARALVARKDFKKQRASAILLQKVYRGLVARREFLEARQAVIRIQSTIRGYLQRKAYLTLRTSVPIVLKAILLRVSRSILLARKIQADKDAELDAIEKKRQEEALALKLAQEEAERQRLIEEEKKRQALLNNPGFQILGLRQEYAATGNQTPIPPEGESQYNFQKYATAYFRANQNISYTEDLIVGGLLGKLNEEEVERANRLQNSMRGFVHASSFANERDCLEQVSLLCLGSQRLIDELYANLMKLTYHNINVTNTLRGWYLMALCLGFLPPSEEIEKYLANYIISRGPDGYGSYCLTLLQRARLNGPRTTKPCSLEFEAARKKQLPSITVHYPPNETASPQVHPTTTAGELCLLIGHALKLTSLSGFSVSLNGTFLSDKDFVLDAISELEAAQGGASQLDFSFQKQYYMPEEPRSRAQNMFVARQVELHLVKEIVKVPEKTALAMSALLFLASGGNFDSVSEANLRSLIPPSAWAGRSAPAVKAAMIEAFEAWRAEKNPAEMDHLEHLLQIAEEQPLFFGKVFQAKQTQGPTLAPPPFSLLVNPKGIFAFSTENSRRILFNMLPFNDLDRISTQEGSLTLSASLVSYVFEMKQSAFFKDMVQSYMLDLKNKAGLYVAVETHKVSDPLLLNFTKGAIIRAVAMEDTAIPGWCKGECNDELGMFPLEFVEGLVGEEPPKTKEALQFQIDLANLEKARAKPISAKWVPSENPQNPAQLADLPSTKQAKKTIAKSPSKTQIAETPQSASSSADADVRASVLPLPSEDPKFNFIEFAKRYFVTPKRQKGTFGKTTLSRLRREKRPSIKEEDVDSEVSMLDISFSPDPLKQPLLLSLEGKKNIKMAGSLSQNIMRCMGDYPSKKDWREHASSIIDEGIQCVELRDELFCQTMKQLTNNTRPTSVERGWWLLNLCVGSFSPSESLFPYLRNFLIQASNRDFAMADIALNSATKLERTAMNGDRQYPPLSLEFDSLMTKRPIVIKVYFPDQSSRSFHLDSGMTSAELLRRVHRKLDSDQGQWAGCAIYISAESFEMSVPPKAYLFDAISEAGVQHSSYRLVFKKKLWLGKEDTSSDALNNIIYHQTLPLYLRGFLVCPVTDMEEKLQEAAFLAALQYKASEDDLRKNQNFGELFRNYLPDSLQDAKTRDEWTETILSAYTSLLNGKSQADAKAMFIDSVRRWPFYGSSFFAVKQSFDSSIPENLTLCVNIKGISALDMTTMNTVLFFKIGEIASWTYGPKHFSMKIHDLQSGDKFIFQTASGEEITDLLEDYISYLLEQKKKSKKKQAQ